MFFSLFGSQTFKTRALFKSNWIYGGNYKLTSHIGSEKILSLYLRLIFGTDTTYNNQKTIIINKKTTTKQQTLGKEENLISRNRLLDSNIQFLKTSKIKKILRNRKVWDHSRKTKSRETASKKGLMAPQ